MTTPNTYRSAIRLLLLFALAFLVKKATGAELTNIPPNQLPKVEIVYPANEQVFVAPTDIEIDVLARDPDGAVALVEFFDGTNAIGRDLRPLVAGNAAGEVQKFSMVWSNVPPGRHSLTARATDNRHGVSVLDAVAIRVLVPCAVPTVSLQAVDNTASEPNPLAAAIDVARFVVKRTCGTNYDLRVQYSVGGSASNGVDYVRLTGAVVIPAGAFSADILIQPLTDNLVEGTESVVIALDPSDCAGVEPTPAGCYLVGTSARDIAFIRDNDDANSPPKIAIVSPQDGSVFLSPTDIRLVATAADSDGWVAYVEFFDGTNSLGIVRNSPLVIDPIRDPAGGPTPIIPSPINPPPFILIWSNVPVGGHLLTALAHDGQGAATRSDAVGIRVIEPPDCALVGIEALDPRASEGTLDPSIDPVPNTATFLVKRRGPTNETLVVFYRIGGTASNGVDYAEIPHAVKIQAGETAARIVIDPIDDALVEGPESVILSLVEPPSLDELEVRPDCYRLARNHAAQAVIYDNDSNPNQPPGVRLLSPEDGDILRAPADIRLLATAFDLDGRVVRVEFFEGTNSLGFGLNPSTVPDPAARPLYSLVWSNVPAGRYLLHAVATDNDGVSTRSEPAEIKVIDFQEPPVVTIAATDPEGREINPLTDQPLDPALFTISRSGPTNRPLVVHYRVGGTAQNGVDYRELPGRLLISAGASSANLFVDVLDDLRCEGDESVIVGLVPWDALVAFPPPADCYRVGQPSRARAVIHDNETCPTNQPPRIAIVRPEEGDRFPAPADIAIYAKAADGDGFVRLVEFFADNRPLCAVSNSPTAVAELFRCHWDNVPAGTYALTARATDNRGATTTSEPVRIRVLELQSRTIVCIAAADDAASEEGPKPATFAVTRSGHTNESLTVFYRLTGTASNGVDYRRLDGTVVIPAGAFSARILVEPIDDALIEGTETVVATLLPPVCIAIVPPPPGCYGVGPCAEATAYIRDNDSAPNHPPHIAILIPSEGESFPAPGNIALTAVGLDPDGWITQVQFYEGTNAIGGLAILVQDPPPPGQLQTFSIRWTGVPPGRYALTAVATDNRGASTRSTPVHVAVLDSCRIPVVTLSAVDALAVEPCGSNSGDPAFFRVRRTCSLEHPLLVRYRVGGTADNGVDYAPVTGQVLIAAGETSADIVIRPLADHSSEGTETVVMELVPPPCLGLDPVTDGCYLPGEPARAIAWIRDCPGGNLPPRVAIVRPETGDLFRERSDIPIVVQTRDADGYVPRVEFLANGVSIGVQEILFFVEPPPGQVQRFSMIWSNVPAGQYVLTAKATDDRGAVTTSGPVKIGVVDLDPIPVVGIAAVDGFAREGTDNTAMFRIRRSGATNQPLTVYFSIHGTASNGVDYVKLPTSVTIPAGRRGTRIVVTPIDDRRPEPIETVVLRLEDSHAYNLARHRRAGAIIVDNDRPHPDHCILPDGLVHLLERGDNGVCYRLEAADDLVNWETLIECLVDDDGLHFLDPESLENPRRFFRLVLMELEEIFDEE